jgi:hypothetical protein
MDSSEDMEMDVEIARLQRLRDSAQKRQHIESLKGEIRKLGVDPEAGPRTPIHEEEAAVSGSRRGAVDSTGSGESSGSDSPSSSSLVPELKSKSRRSARAATAVTTAEAELECREQTAIPEWADAFGQEYLQLIAANKDKPPGTTWEALPGKTHWGEEEAAHFGRRWKAERDAKILFAPLPKGWKTLVCEQSGDMFYQDESTNLKTWSRPRVIVIPRNKPNAQHAKEEQGQMHKDAP